MHLPKRIPNEANKWGCKKILLFSLILFVCFQFCVFCQVLFCVFLCVFPSHQPSYLLICLHSFLQLVNYPTVYLWVWFSVNLGQVIFCHFFIPYSHSHFIVELCHIWVKLIMSSLRLLSKVVVCSQTWSPAFWDHHQFKTKAGLNASMNHIICTIGFSGVEVAIAKKCAKKKKHCYIS